MVIIVSTIMKSVRGNDGSAAEIYEFMKYTSRPPYCFMKLCHHTVSLWDELVTSVKLMQVSQECKSHGLSLLGIIVLGCEFLAIIILGLGFPTMILFVALRCLEMIILFLEKVVQLQTD